jgi:hypothetical protein
MSICNAAILGDSNSTRTVVFNISGEPESVEHVVGVDFPCAARYCSAPPRFLRSDLQPNPIRTESAKRSGSQSPLSKRPPFFTPVFQEKASQLQAHKF